MSTAPFTRRFRASDKEQIGRLFEVVWGKTVAEDARVRWRWKFEQNPCNPQEGSPIWVTEVHNEIVAVIAGMPIFLKVKNTVTRALWGVDFCAHPNHRRVALQMLQKFLRQPYVMLGAPDPTQAGYKVEKKLGMFDVCQLVRFAKILNFGHVLRHKFIGKPPTALINTTWRLLDKGVSLALPPYKKAQRAIVQCKRFDSAFDEFCSDVTKNYPIITHRTSAFLNWRFINCPNRHYTIDLAMEGSNILGYVVYRLGETKGIKCGIIVDLLAMPNDQLTFCALIAQAVKSLQAEGADIVKCIMPAHHRTQVSALRQAGFFFSNTIMHIVAKNNCPNLSNDQLHPESAWYITAGDSDIEVTM